MAARKSRPSLADRTPVAEWTAAALGLVMTLGVVGYTLWEGLTEDPGHPRLTVTAQTATPNGATHVVPIVVRNASHATAAQVEVRAVLRSPAGVSEERRASFAYVPGRGEARGGLVFRQNPARAELDLSIEGYAEP